VMDIIVNCKSGSSEGVRGFFNNFYNDAFFLKTTGLNGVCAGWCDGSIKFPDPKPYGVNYAGGVWKFTVSDLNGNQRVAEGVQLTQSTHLSLQTPYLLFGLGRTSNYVEQLFYGTTFTQFSQFSQSSSNSDSNSKMWICIIPNAQIVAIPFPVSQSEEWTLELFIKTSSLTVWVIIAFLASLFVNALLIAFFVWQERREDQKLQAEASSMFSFRAL